MIIYCHGRDLPLIPILRQVLPNPTNSNIILVWHFQWSRKMIGFTIINNHYTWSIFQNISCSVLKKLKNKWTHKWDINFWRSFLTQVHLIFFFPIYQWFWACKEWQDSACSNNEYTKNHKDCCFIPLTKQKQRSSRYMIKCKGQYIEVNPLLFLSEALGLSFKC